MTLGKTRTKRDKALKIGAVTNPTGRTMTQAAARTDKILVVDDDARIRDLLRRYLTQEGFEVILAEDGKALNRLMLRETADLIVLDLMMPGEDGLSICRRLRAANDRTPIIMLTAKGEDVDRIVGLEVGADDYLGKPFNPRELLARIKAVLRRAGETGPNRAAGELRWTPLVRQSGWRVKRESRGIIAPCRCWSSVRARGES
jgi:DNA-binding response OmpR family regulator